MTEKKRQGLPAEVIGCVNRSRRWEEDGFASQLDALESMLYGCRQAWEVVPGSWEEGGLQVTVMLRRRGSAVATKVRID